MRIVVPRPDGAGCSSSPPARRYSQGGGTSGTGRQDGGVDDQYSSDDDDYGMESGHEDDYENENEDALPSPERPVVAAARGRASRSSSGTGDAGSHTPSAAAEKDDGGKPGTSGSGPTPGCSNVRAASERAKSVSPTGSGHGDGDKAGSSGYNSADEHRGKLPRAKSSGGGTAGHDNLDRVLDEAAREKEFEDSMKREKNYAIRRVKEDGNCLFRSVSDQMYGDEEAHANIRQMCFDYMMLERDHFSPFVTEDFDDYVARKRKDKCYGNHLEIQCMSEMFNRPIEVYTYSTVPINVHMDLYKTDMPPIRVSYHRGNHYNSVVDPTAPAVGVGLGLPEYRVGTSAENELVEEVKKITEQEELDAYVLEESRKLADLEQTERVLEASLIESSYRDHVQRAQRGASMGGGGGASSSHGMMPPAGSSSSSRGPAASVNPVVPQQSAFAQDFYDVACDNDAMTLDPNAPMLPPAVQKLGGMGFLEAQLVEAYSIFGDNVENILCYLTAENSEWAQCYADKFVAHQRTLKEQRRNREKNGSGLKRPADAPM